MIKVYVAGPWQDRPAVRVVADRLREVGYGVECRWLDHDEIAEDDPKRDDYLREQALHDIQDLLSADAMVYVNSRKSEGKATELGMAIATLKPIIIVGDRRNNIFLNLNIPAFPNIDEAIHYMAEHGGPTVAE